ncbi:hypothetical protein RA180_21980 [Aeromonas salmonicida]|uniref:hypothetical protein n=1 Tax=Aeromonas salmonicida TaxID=645 RepID=UPI002796D6D2|nr:hypothetical protein [Aeromonas salmonicida]MDQ1886662.1 hypothetical protein [Aeromonas salmonicida]
MKIRFDFVSNSSSTSFVYISGEELTEEFFFEATGVDKNSPVRHLFHQMYVEINAAIQHYGTQLTTTEDVESHAASHEFTPDVIKKMIEAIEQGKSVITSRLSSDGEFAESLMCMEMFEIESDHFYINAFNNYW